MYEQRFGAQTLLESFLKRFVNLYIRIYVYNELIIREDE